MEAQRITMLNIYTDYTNDLLNFSELPEEIEKSSVKKQAIENLIKKSKENNHDILKRFGKKQDNFSDNLHELGILIKKEEKEIWKQTKN